MITLEQTTAAPWASANLAQEALRLRGLIAILRKRAATQSLARQAANYVADAYEEAALLLERRLAGINPAQERTS